MKLAAPLAKPYLFAGPSRRELKAFPDEVRGRIGHGLHQVQCGQEPDSAKALKGFGSRGVLELIEDYDGNTFRTVYRPLFRRGLRARRFSEEIEERHRNA